MTDLTIVGIALLGFTIIGGSYVLGEHIQAKAQTSREHIEERYEKRYADKCKEADQWRLAFEEARIEAIQLRARLDIQNRLLAKTKVRDLKK